MKNQTYSYVQSNSLALLATARVHSYRLTIPVLHVVREAFTKFCADAQRRIGR